MIERTATAHLELVKTRDESHTSALHGLEIFRRQIHWL